ncbi:MAG: type IV secretion system protein [Stellaceae bacterium]
MAAARTQLTAALILFAFPAAAQTGGGMNPLAIIAQYESSNGTQLQNPQSTASGIWQDVNGTWAQALSLCSCGSAAQYPTAISAPASVQAAANAALYNSQGFAPWSSNTALLAAINAAGGNSAFAAPGALSSSIASYAGLNTQSVASYFSTNGVATAGGNGLTVSTSTSAGTAATVSSTPGTLNSSFTWMWNNTIGTVQTALSGLIGVTQQMVQDYLTPFLCLGVLVLGYRLFVGRDSYSSLMTFVVRVSIVVALTAVGSTFYQTYITQSVVGLPGWWQSYISGTATAATTPVSLLDAVYNAVWAAIEKMAASTSPVPWYWGHDVLIVIAGFCAWIMTDIGLWLMFVSIWATTLLSYVAVALGPLIIPFAIFPLTQGIVWSWAWAIGTLLATLLSVDLMLSLWESILKALLAALTISGTPDTDIPSAVQLGFVVFAMGTALAGAGWLAGRIFGAAAEIGLDRASYWLSGSAIRDGASAAPRVAARVTSAL